MPRLSGVPHKMRTFPLRPLTLCLATATIGIASTSLHAETPAEAVFAGGCFWCMEPPYDRQSGVTATISGYTGGELENPTYDDVSSGETDHIEVVKVEYDADQISYAQLLEIYWRNIDPFAVGRQFCDVGDQYRSAIFYQNDEQRELAEASKAEMEDRFDEAIATDILPAETFWKAEEYHQNYYDKNPVRYKFYRFSCGRADRLDAVWGDEAGGPTFD